MAKKIKSDFTSPTVVMNTESHYQGLGYYIPSNTDAKALRQLFTDWNERLAASGHNDIEHFSSLLIGKTSPRLKGRHNSDLHNAPSLFNYQLADTYMSNYFEHTKPTDKRLARFWSSDKVLLTLFTAGINLGEIERLFKSPTEAKVERFKSDYGLEHLTNYSLMLHKGRSKFWIYHRTKTALAHCYAWHNTDINGELTDSDLDLYRLHGIDSKDTETIINRYRAKAGKEPLKLKWLKKLY